MEKYKCDICKKNHTIHYGVGHYIPEIVDEILNGKRDEDLRQEGHMYIIGNEKVLINGTIYVEVKELSTHLYWQVWVDITKEAFFNAVENKADYRIRGHLTSDSLFYDNMNELVVWLLLGEDKSSTEVIIDDEKHPLYQDQKEGISKERLLELMQRIHHPELHKGTIIPDEPFSERLLKELNLIENEYFKKGENCSINISSPGVILFQIVNRSLLECVKDQNDGFGLHLAFDDSDEEKEEERLRLEKQDYYSAFTFCHLDEVPIYQIDLENDKYQIIALSEKLLKDVYMQDLKTVEIDHFEI